MKSSSLALLFLWTAAALGQQAAECTRELAATDDCADVINANACYNQFRFTSRQTLTCIGGTDDADRIRKVCSARVNVEGEDAKRIIM
ncbi:hypothetical protein F4775DRAFT_562217 [Biscogniauxia sp. FL1348]|nr:hypothetical protein F4775DRAFT_562217 [Biscogniauxia sp. FL1348]